MGGRVDGPMDRWMSFDVWVEEWESGRMDGRQAGCMDSWMATLNYAWMDG